MSHKFYGVNELREMFLSFFESKGHLRLPSFSLIPQNDQSLLLINSGMAPMKPLRFGIGRLEFPQIGFSGLEKRIISGSMAPVPAAPARKFTMTGERSSAVENRIARWAAIATGIWRFGITYFLSLTTTDTAIIPIWPKRISIPAWV